MINYRDSWQYHLIAKHYEGKLAKRSKLPYIKHIDEGVEILNRIWASEDTISAFILHPLFQSDEDLKTYWNTSTMLPYPRMDKMDIILVMEYRNIANAFLSKHQGLRTATLSPIHEVNLMLLADKVQNQADFYRYQDYKGEAATMSEFHYKKLEQYFNEWRTLLEEKFPTEMAKFPLYEVIEQRQLFPVESYETSKITEGVIYDFTVDS